MTGCSRCGVRPPAASRRPVPRARVAGYSELSRREKNVGKRAHANASANACARRCFTDTAEACCVRQGHANHTPEHDKPRKTAQPIACPREISMFRHHPLLPSAGWLARWLYYE
ncbi:hypothetical protein M3J09_002976 [Ascochyta lentis]